MLVRGLSARVGGVLAVCLAALAVTAPGAGAHPEECLGGAAKWGLVVPWSEEEFLGGDGTCTPAAVAATYDTSGAQLAAGEEDGRNLRLLVNRPKTGTHAGPTAFNSDIAFWGDLRVPGQLQRVPDQGRQGPGEPAAHQPGLLSRLAERHLRLEEPALPVDGQQPQRRQLRRAWRSR